MILALELPAPGRVSGGAGADAAERWHRSLVLRRVFTAYAEE